MSLRKCSNPDCFNVFECEEGTCTKLCTGCEKKKFKLVEVPENKEKKLIKG